MSTLGLAGSFRLIPGNNTAAISGVAGSVKLLGQTRDDPLRLRHCP